MVGVGRTELAPAATLDEKFNTAVVGFFLLRREVAPGEFPSQTMIMETFAAKRMFVTRICASTVFTVDFGPRAMILLSHINRTSLEKVFSRFHG